MVFKYHTQYSHTVIRTYHEFALLFEILLIEDIAIYP